MKKVLFLVLASFLALAACGNSEESKSEDKKETKSSSKDDKKKDENKKSNDDKKEKSDKENTDKKETLNTDNTQQDDTQQANTEQQPQSTQEPIQSQEQPTKQEQIEANAEWNRQNIKGGTDAGMIDPGDEYYSNDQLDPETGLPKDDAIPRKAGEEPTEEEIAQAEKDALREKYNGGLSSGEIQTKNAIEQGYYDGDDADEVMSEIEKSEQEIADGKYDEYKE